MIIMTSIVVFAAAVAVAAGMASSQKIPRALDVGALNGHSYRSFLNELRSGLADAYSRDVPVLPTYDDAHPVFFDITLVNGDQETTVRFRRDNIRVRGFQMQEPQQWLEFGRRPSDRHLIPGSEFLGFGDSYEEMEHAAERPVEQVSLNKESLRNAVSRLALPADRRQRAEALIVVSQMISEAAKFLDISEYLASNLESRAPVLLEPWMRTDLENKWEHYSLLVLRCEANSACNFEPPIIRGKQISTVDDLRNVFGIIFRCSASRFDFNFKARTIEPEVCMHS